MKRITSRLAVLLFCMLSLLPVGSVFAFCIGYTFALASYHLYAVGSAVLSVVVAVRSLVSGAEENKSTAVLCSILPPISLICTVFCVFKCRSVIVAFAMLVCVGCCFISAAKSGQPFGLKAASLALSALTILPITFIVFIVLTFGNIGENKVIRSIDSPDGRYTAQVIDADQGALGGDTVVRVVKNRGLELLVLSVRKKPQTVYIGEWGEAENITVYWSDEREVTVNSYAHKIK